MIEPRSVSASQYTPVTEAEQQYWTFRSDNGCTCGTLGVGREWAGGLGMVSPGAKAEPAELMPADGTCDAVNCSGPRERRKPKLEAGRVGDIADRGRQCTSPKTNKCLQIIWPLDMQTTISQGPKHKDGSTWYSPTPVLLDIPPAAGARFRRPVDRLLAGPELLRPLEECLRRGPARGRGSLGQGTPLVAGHACMPQHPVQEACLAPA